MKKRHVELSEKDKTSLDALLSKGALKVRVQKRAMALQMLDKGMTYQSVKTHLGVNHVSLSQWAKRYKAEGLDMLYDKTRSGRPPKFSGEEQAKVTALACSTPPRGYAKWSLRLLSNRLVELNLVEDISHTEVGRILKKTNYSLIVRNNGVLQS
jgi:transposase